MRLHHCITVRHSGLENNLNRKSICLYCAIRLLYYCTTYYCTTQGIGKRSNCKFFRVCLQIASCFEPIGCLGPASSTSAESASFTLYPLRSSHARLKLRLSKPTHARLHAGRRMESPWRCANGSANRCPTRTPPTPAQQKNNKFTIKNANHFPIRCPTR